jgi:hypothetical protein
MKRFFLLKNLKAVAGGRRPAGHVDAYLPSAHLLQSADFLLDILDQRLHAADLMPDLLRALAIAGLLRLRERVLQLAQLLMKPRQLVTELSELSAVRILGGLSRSWLLRRDVPGQRADEC